MQDESSFHTNILQNMNEGVMTLDFSGAVIMFNHAAARILGLAPERVLGRRFAEVFMMEMEGNDGFNQAVLDAVYQTGVGSQSVVEYTRQDGTKLNLSVTSSFLKDASEDSEEANSGVIVVFSDVTQLQQLQEAQQELNRQLAESYRKLEETNQSLRSALKKVQVVRVLATLFIIGLVGGLGYWQWSPATGALASLVKDAEGKRSGQHAQHLNTLRIEPRPVSNSISLTGELEPLRQVHLAAPYEGRVKETNFYYGQIVNKGDVLLELDPAKLEVKLRKARTTFIQAKQKYQQIVNWTQSNEVSRARRSYTKAQSTLDAARRKLEENKLLYGKGIVPKNDLDSAQQSLDNAELDFKAAKEELDSTLQQGSAENVRIAHLELENSQFELQELEQKRNASVIAAPLAGIVVKPAETGKDNKQQQIEQGVKVSEGQILLGIGDLSGLVVKAQVDEVDIGNLSIGQEVRVFGDAFPDVELNGEIAHISSQADKGSGGVATFEVVVQVSSLTEKERAIVRIGMSANLEVKVYENPQALLVPIFAVGRGSDSRTVTVLKDGEPVLVPVQTGLTTLNSVEITQGLQPGDTVVLP